MANENNAKKTAGVSRTPGLSIVVPCFNEAAGLAQFHGKLAAVARALKSKRGLAIEVIYVDDGSRDNTFAVASSLPAQGLDVQAAERRLPGLDAPDLRLRPLQRARRGADREARAVAEVAQVPAELPARDR